MVIRAGYGVYYDTSVYQTIAMQMAQQPPLSKSFSVQNSAADPLTLANGFNASPAITPQYLRASIRTSASDMRRTGKSSVQRDLPGSLQLTATYLGIKGTRGPQEFLPNTYPIGAVESVPGLSGRIRLSDVRRQFHAAKRDRFNYGAGCITASPAILQYTFSKSIDDDAALGGQGAGATRRTVRRNRGFELSRSSANLAIAQNWLNLSAERGLSTFDQRHLLSLQLQYTTGMGIARRYAA